MKLLCRLYDPQAGAVLVDGVDLRQLEVDSWRARVAAVFQDFVATRCRFATTWRRTARRRQRCCER